MKSVIALFVLVGVFWLAATAESLDAIMARMDTASPGFRSMAAKVRKISYTAVIQDKTTEAGTLYVLRKSPRDVRLKIDFESPDPRSVAFQNRKYLNYLPKIQTVQEYDLGKQASLVDQFLLLGFGTSGRDLAGQYDMKLAGQETIEGTKTTRLELIPKSSKAREHLTKVEMWIPEGESYPIQQKFHQPSGDYYLTTYTDVKINPGLTEKDLDLRLPKGVKKETPQR